ncbi:hypothetical protein [Streptomyces sp. enrichment culture]|uniref:hypothetical protein n=1 Tax=Streptomyces sp. enrichment culture TaxID=1795815 RepID=UPI003F550076
MPVEPVPCEPGGGTSPVEVTTCCAPSIASAPLCRADGTTILAVVRSGCVECGEAPEDPAVVGWLDTAGTFTPGPLPDDVGPCEAGCVDTICRQLCDDTDADGTADATYSELWCIRADGSAELVLTYQDDPSSPYTPVAPVDCTYGCPESETVMLCDDAGPFLRRYTFLNGTATYEDVALDGQTPHVVTGTVGACGGDTGCEEQTTPAATLGLCLADGTPIAVVVTRSCDGTVTQDGWLNLVTGAYSVGDPPTGTMACGNPRSISTTGTFCDVDAATGDVYGLVLIEYTYGPDGDVAAVRLVDATTGQTYTPQGEVTTCPAGVAQPERDLIQLCDVADDGTVTEFVRDFARDENGQITGHTDYLLDGAPYTPTGAVGRCVDECHDCETVILCDTVATPPATIAGTAASGTLSNGVAYATTAPNPFAPGRQSDGAAWWGTALFPNPVVPLTRWTFDQPVNVDFSVAMVWSPATTLPGENTVQVPPGAVPLSLPAGYTFNQATGILRADSTLTGCTLNAPTRETSARFRLTGVSTFTLQYLGSRVLSSECRRFGTWEFGALDVSLGGEFARTVCRDCTGAVTSSTDTLLDGTTPYTPVGLVGVCQPEATDEEPCRDSSSTLLCDTVAQEAVTVFDPANRPGADGWEIVSYTGYGPGYGPEAAIPYPVPHPAGSPAYMGVRSDLNVGPGVAWTGYDTAPVRWVMRKTFTAPEDGVAVVSSTGFRGDGGARVRINGIDASMYGQWNQPATTGTAQIPVTAGPNTVEIEVRDGAGPNWITGRLDVVMTRTVQFMRRTVVDCATGETVSVVDTTLDGEPYEVTGEVGQCEPVAECCEQPPPETRVDVETVLLCVRDTATGDVLGQVLAERVYDDQSGALTEQRLTDLAGTAYTLPAGAELTKCPSPDRITRQVCVVESGRSEFLTNPTNATSGQDTAWQWAPNLTGLWHPMYRVAPNPVWTATDTAPNQAHWVSPHANRTVCPTAGETSPPVPGTWYTRASWNLPADVDPESIRIAATVLNADNKVVQWRLNDGAWQPVGGGTLANPAWTFPPTAVPGGRAGQNEVVVQLLETQPAVSCPSPNEAGMILHVIATYDYEPRVWTQVIEQGGQTYYLDENGDRQDSIPDGQRLVPCGSGGDAPCCPAVNTEPVTLCDVAGDGTSTTFLRHFTYTEGTDTPAVRDTLLDGTPYTPTGAVTVCQPDQGEPCRDSAVLLVCDLPTDGTPIPTVTDTSGAPYYPYPSGVAAAGAQALWDGGTLTLPDAAGPQPGTTGTVRTAAAVVQAPRPACDAGTARVTVQVDVTQLGPDDGCAATGFLGLYNGVGEANRIALALAPPHTPAGWSGTLTVEADVPADDLAAGNIAVLLAFDAYDDSGTVCPPPRRTGWQLSEFDATVVYDQAGCETQILRTVVTDCETGAVLTVTDTTLDGDPYTVTGEVGQCTAAGGECCPLPEPCGDTEVAQLCDLTYDPQAPIPTPARDWTLTGNVVAANDGTTLWFAQANQAADGVAELTVSGLLPATLYEFSFASAWIGAGAPDPANNNAVYLLEILDGATVLATRTRNVSQGSNVFPGGVLTEDLPALAFIAPATGAVTLRFTDLTTGGPVNDRDLFLMPLEVRTAVLTVTRTPFLRRFTYDCDGALTSSADLGLDGATPYTVAGEVGQCAADGDGSSVTVPPCDANTVIQACRCDDTDGDGLPDIGYVELLAVDCDGILTSLGTYTDGLTEPYTPVSPVDCNTIGDDEGADPAHGVQARRVELAVGASWDAAAWPTLQSVTAVAHGGTGTITTADGPSTLRPGESVTWSVARDVDAALTGPLTITTVTGTVTVSWTQGVTL